MPADAESSGVYDEAATAPRFKVFVETTARLGGPSGWLTVYQGLLVLDASPASARALGSEREQQSTHLVRWVRQPLFPPWINRAIDFIPDSSRTAIRLRPTRSGRRVLRESLVAAGFQVVDETSWSILFGP